MEQAYFGPTQMAVEHLNRELALPATGAEQDWELELADPNKLALMIQLLNSDTLDGETKSALVALTLHSIQQAYDDGADVSAAVLSLRTQMRTDAALRTQMIDYWSRFDPVLAALA